jgi:hypothetical protein
MSDELQRFIDRIPDENWLIVDPNNLDEFNEWCRKEEERAWFQIGPGAWSFVNALYLLERSIIESGRIAVEKLLNRDDGD